MEKTIMILDDDAVFRGTMLKPKLEERGFRVLEAGRAKEGVAVVTENKIDLMIVDGLLPDKSGVDFIKAVREVGDETPIIFISAFWKDMDTFQQLSAIGVKHVLRKPVNLEDLCRKIDEVFAPPAEAEPGEP